LLALRRSLPHRRGQARLEPIDTLDVRLGQRLLVIELRAERCDVGREPPFVKTGVYPANKY